MGGTRNKFVRLLVALALCKLIIMFVAWIPLNLSDVKGSIRQKMLPKHTDLSEKEFQDLNSNFAEMDLDRFLEKLESYSLSRMPETSLNTQRDHTGSAFQDRIVIKKLRAPPNLISLKKYSDLNPTPQLPRSQPDLDLDPQQHLKPSVNSGLTLSPTAAEPTDFMSPKPSSAFVKIHSPEMKSVQPQDVIKMQQAASIGEAIVSSDMVGQPSSVDIPTNNSSQSNTESPKLPIAVDQSKLDNGGGVPQEKPALANAGGELYNRWFKHIHESQRRPNILFIVADDLRPDIGIYNQLSNSHGSPWLNQKMHTPNLDRLASRSMLYTRAYCQIPWCNPSRTSFLTSRRPDTTMVHNNTVYFRQNNPNFVTLPQYFRNQGYFTSAAGKVFHRLRHLGDSDDFHSWSVHTHSVKASEVYVEPTNTWAAVAQEQLHGKKLLDQITASLTMETLDNLAKQPSEERKPFFVAMGMKKPHLPFVFPKEFLDYYPIENMSVPENPTAPKNMPKIAWFNSFEVRGRSECLPYAKKWTATHSLPNELLAHVRRGYYASVTYIDDLIGQVLNKLESTGLSNNTIITFIGDHGFHLGEQSIVGKNTAFEVAANSPMMIHVPGVSDPGIVTDRLVEFVDIFPTLMELAGYPKMPYCPPGRSRSVDMCTEGTSLVPLFEEALGKTIKWKESIFYQYPHFTGKARYFCMGYSIRTAKYRYTEWTPYHYNKAETPEVSRTDLCGVELYDHQKDPLETNNIADDVTLIEVRQELSSKLEAGWIKALPQNS